MGRGMNSNTDWKMELALPTRGPMSLGMRTRYVIPADDMVPELLTLSPAHIWSFHDYGGIQLIIRDR